MNKVFDRIRTQLESDSSWTFLDREVCLKSWKSLSGIGAWISYFPNYFLGLFWFMSLESGNGTWSQLVNSCCPVFSALFSFSGCPRPSLDITSILIHTLTA